MKGDRRLIGLRCHQTVVEAGGVEPQWLQHSTIVGGRWSERRMRAGGQKSLMGVNREMPGKHAVGVRPIIDNEIIGRELVAQRVGQ